MNNWEDTKSEELTLEQARCAVSDLRKRLAKCLEQKPCEDCVSREAVIEAIHKQMFKFVDKAIDEQSEETDDKVDLLLTVNKGITGTIRSLPPVTPRQKYGKWLAQQEANGDDYSEAYDINGVMTYAAKYKCDKCGFIQTCIEDHGQYNYCPNCGAKMQGKGVNMGDIEVVIKIDEGYFNNIKETVKDGDSWSPYLEIAKGVSLPKGHGRLIDESKIDWLTNYDGSKFTTDKRIKNTSSAILEADWKGR